MNHTKRILLVDDDTDDQVYFLDAVSQVYPAMECKVANNGLEALEYVQIQPAIDFIFLDLNMPIMNGFEFLNRLKEKFENIPVVIFTTSKNALDIERTKELGANLFFTKPTNFNILCEKLKKIFDIGFSMQSFII